jgi:2-polyprenyl-6-methoxyphenol hydroxylase-like FAD-dependent oxidoreductase
MTQIDCDVAIVGYGPVGQVLAGLLAQDGHTVTVVERHRDLYGMPRAIRFDGEVMRMFQRLGVVDDISNDIRSPLVVTRS